MIVQWKSKLPITQPKTTIRKFKVSNTNYPTILESKPKLPNQMENAKNNEKTNKKKNGSHSHTKLPIPNQWRNTIFFFKQKKNDAHTKFPNQKQWKTYKSNVFKQWKQKKINPHTVSMEKSVVSSWFSPLST